MSIEVHDIGNQVICDFCGADYTDKDESGGILFGSKAACPTCTPGLEAGAKQYDEQSYIRGHCPPGMSFRDWCLQLRGGDNTIRIYTGDDAMTEADRTEKM